MNSLVVSTSPIKSKFWNELRPALTISFVTNFKVGGGVLGTTGSLDSVVNPGVTHCPP